MPHDPVEDDSGVGDHNEPRSRSQQHDYDVLIAVPEAVGGSQRPLQLLFNHHIYSCEHDIFRGFYGQVGVVIPAME